MERKDGKSYPLRESSPRERKEKESERSIFEERERRKGNCANFKKERKKKKKGVSRELSYKTSSLRLLLARLFPFFRTDNSF